MNNVYCGNNRLNTSGNPIGTRYLCLKKGIGVGKSLPCDGTINDQYEAIDTRKVWCGRRKSLPAGYDILGNLPMCLQKGVGMGKYEKCSNEKYSFYKSYFFWILVIAVISILIFIFIRIRRRNSHEHLDDKKKGRRRAY